MVRFTAPVVLSTPIKSITLVCSRPIRLRRWPNDVNLRGGYLRSGRKTWLSGADDSSSAFLDLRDGHRLVVGQGCRCRGLRFREHRLSSGTVPPSKIQPCPGTTFRLHRQLLHSPDLRLLQRALNLL